MSELSVWRFVPGHPKYQVSDQGGFRRVLRPVPTTGKRRFDPQPFKTIKGYRQASGHIRVELQRPHRATYLHILIAEAFLGPKPSAAHIVLHWNDIPDDNRLVNLRWGTDKDNHSDALRNGRRSGTSVMKARTVCPRGHLLQAPNLSKAHTKSRTCEVCRRVSNSAWGQRVRRAGTPPTRHPEFQARTDAIYALLGEAPI